MKLTKTRTPDFFITDAGEIWDLKTSISHDAKQLEDYIKILGHAEPDLPKVTSINYLFHSKDYALANKALAKRPGVFVRYIDDAGNISPTNGAMMKSLIWRNATRTHDWMDLQIPLRLLETWLSLGILVTNHGLV